MIARRDAALQALGEGVKAAGYLAQIERGTDARLETLLELELLLGLDSPPELQPQRLALQVKLLRERFQSSGKTGPEKAVERLLAWCSQSGVVETSDRERCDRVFSAIERTARRASPTAQASNVRELGDTSRR